MIFKLSAAVLSLGLLVGLAVTSANAEFSPAVPIVTDHVQNGVRELQIIIPGQGKTLESYKVGSLRCFKKQEFDKDNTMTQEKNFNDQGELMSQTFRYFTADGRKLVRHIHASEMTVEVFGKDGSFSYSQRWELDANKSYKLKEVRIGSGHTRRRVVLKDDGTTVDHVDYQVCGIVSWCTVKTEAGDKLSEPVDKQMLQELNRAGDPSIPADLPVSSSDKN